VERLSPALSLRQEVEANVGRDAIEPRTERGAALEPVQAPPSANQRLLNGVVRVEHGAQHAVTVSRQVRAEPFEIRRARHGGTRHARHVLLVALHGRVIRFSRADKRSAGRSARTLSSRRVQWPQQKALTWM